MYIPTEPTPEQCTARAEVFRGDKVRVRACWYPQMGGYVGKAVVVMHQVDDGCFETYIWHDGEFPFAGEDGPNPVHLHHCAAQQFVQFGQDVKSWQDEP